MKPARGPDAGRLRCSFEMLGKGDKSMGYASVLVLLISYTRDSVGVLAVQETLRLASSVRLFLCVA